MAVQIDLTTLSGYESLPAGTYALAVKSKAANYQDSDLSATVSFTKLAAPVATASDTTVTWEAITNAESYDVYVDGELYENTTGGVNVTYSNVTLEKVYVGGQIQSGSYISIGYSKISNADTTKYYLLRYAASIDSSFSTAYLYWDSASSKWKVANSQTYGFISIVDSKSNSTEIVFCKIDNYEGAFEGWIDCQCLMTDAQPESATITDDVFTNNNATIQSIAYYICIIEGTLITLSDHTTKPIEDITYNDDILVWNFYEGKFDSAKPCWIIKPQVATEYNLCKFSNGAEVGFVGQGGNIGYHRIYNDEAKAFTHTGVAETPVGTHTFAEDDSFPELVSQEVIKKTVRFYNVGTTKHINLFANGILTSSRISNKYAIEDMKYVGEQLISDSEERAYIDEKLTHC